MTIRARLTLWYGLVLSAMLVAFAASTYSLLEEASLRRIDSSLESTARAFAAAWLTSALPAGSEGNGPARMMSRYASGNLELVVLDRARAVVAREPLRNSGGVMESTPRARLEALIGIAGAEGNFATLAGSDERRRVFAITTALPFRSHTILVARGLTERDQMLGAARDAFGLAVGVMLVLALAGGYFIARHALAPVAALAAQAQQISAATIHGRLASPTDSDELGQLTRAFNHLLARLERAFTQQREFMADASHELRTPIAVVRGEADVALAHERPTEEYRESLLAIREEGRRMSRLVDDMLLLARSDASGGEQIVSEELYLDDIVAGSVRAFRAIAKGRDVTLQYEPAGEMPMRGDPTLLRRLVDNLIDNAMKYGGAGGDILVRLSRSDAHCVVTVEDHGPGVPLDIRDQLFDRFVRGSSAGAGLGLAIARRIAEAHGGTLDLSRSHPGLTEFRLTLPVRGATTS